VLVEKPPVVPSVTVTTNGALTEPVKSPKPVKDATIEWLPGASVGLMPAALVSGSTGAVPRTPLWLLNVTDPPPAPGLIDAVSDALSPATMVA